MFCFVCLFVVVKPFQNKNCSEHLVWLNYSFFIGLWIFRRSKFIVIFFFFFNLIFNWTVLWSFNIYFCRIICHCLHYLELRHFYFYWIGVRYNFLQISIWNITSPHSCIEKKNKKKISLHFSYNNSHLLIQSYQILK